MYLLPYQRVAIKTTLDADEIRLRLVKYMQGVSWGLGALDNAPYSGLMGEDRFEIRRVTGQRSPFAPLISGTLHPIVGEAGTQVRLALRLPAPIPAAILGGLAFCALCTALAWLFTLSQAYGLLFLLWILGLGIPLTAFRTECFRDEQWMRRLVIDPPPRRTEDYLPYGYTPPPPAAPPVHNTEPLQTPARPWIGGSRPAHRYAPSPPDWIPDHETE